MQETRLFDEARQETFSMRSKEGAHRCLFREPVNIRVIIRPARHLKMHDDTRMVRLCRPGGLPLLPRAGPAAPPCDRGAHRRHQGGQSCSSSCSPSAYVHLLQQQTSLHMHRPPAAAPRRKWQAPADLFQHATGDSAAIHLGCITPAVLEGLESSLWHHKSM